MKIIILVLLSFLSTAIAQDAVNIKVETEDVTIKPTQEKKEAYVKDKTYDLNNLTTRESRSYTNFQITTGVGMEIEDTPALHLTFAKNITRDLLAQARVSFPIGIEEDGEDHDFIFTEAGLKIFTGNSFFITPSIYYAKGESLQRTSILGTAIDDASGMGLMFTIGNEWRINKNLVIGADWVGVGYTLIEFDEKVQAGVARILNFNIGYAF